MYAEAAEINLITDAGLRGELELDSYRTEPVFSSITITEGSAKEVVDDSCENTFVIATESAAYALVLENASKPATRQASHVIRERMGRVA